MLYCLYCKRYLEMEKWAALLSVYVLMGIAIYIQFIRPELMVEMFATALGLLIVLMLVIRPEESRDPSVGVQSWTAFQNDLRNILLTGEQNQIIVMHMPMARENRNFLGDEAYTAFVRELISVIDRHVHTQAKGKQYQIYFEHPDNIYLTIDNSGCEVDEFVRTFLESAQQRIRPFTDRGIRFEPKICQIRYPDDLVRQRDIIHLCHDFPQLMQPDQVLCSATEIVKSRDFDVQNHIEEILDRAIKGKTLEMYYQPIYNVSSQCFDSAEALARLKDPVYGMISPNIFIPAAERIGLIQPLGKMVIETVFRFISRHDLQSLGLSYMEINLSVAQCLQRDLPDIIESLQQQYGVKPNQVNFEITETILGTMSDILDRNIGQLCEMGYRFSLDDYGTGYSNIQRLRRLPLSLIKIDKSLVDDMFSEEGDVIMQNTVHMMKGIHKGLIMEGVETKQELDALGDMACDFIQGFYFSKPLPERQFVEFLETHRQTGNNGAAPEQH